MDSLRYNTYNLSVPYNLFGLLRSSTCCCSSFCYRPSHSTNTSLPQLARRFLSRTNNNKRLKIHSEIQVLPTFEKVLFGTLYYKYFITLQEESNWISITWANAVTIRLLGGPFSLSSPQLCAAYSDKIPDSKWWIVKEWKRSKSNKSAKIVEMTSMAIVPKAPN